MREPNNKNRNSYGSNQSLLDKEDIYDIKGDFCLCYFYQRECLYENGSAFFCKHVLAAKLAEAFGKIAIKEIEDRDFAPLFLGTGRHLNKYEDNKKK